MAHTETAVVATPAVAANNSGLPSTVAPAAEVPAAQVSLSIPPGAIPAAAQVTVQAVADLGTLAVIAPTPSVDVTIVSALVAVATDRQNNDIKDPFASAVQMTVSIPSTAVPSGASPQDYVVAFWDTKNETWVPLADQAVTAMVTPDGAVTLLVDLPHFTMYAVLFQSTRLNAEQASTIRGTFSTKPIFSAGGQALSILQGGSVDQLESATRSVGASGVWVQDSTGTFQLLLVGGPSFLKDSFRTTFPLGFGNATSVLLVR